ncbi:hypothetical protein P3X46_031922 [Hevea brasiliensis]|uniref:Uncharacterized protein n=1 Tax=Hevea brasiliensis TaxID=3981 RepID=A0ABQ9KNB9_HEVBR|nr:UPF0481 protein At3g47200-like [Hevea brasiliensis]KAJ9141380.1 hypothetical protein P3X46_031922 [Hevea brasiliensis]
MNSKDKLDVKDIAKSLNDDLAILQPLSDECCIYRAPERVRKLYEESYTPQLESIGPLHHGKEKLKAMEEHKRRYLLDFLQWSDSSLVNLITYIKQNERRLRNCYAETIEYGSEKFVKMMSLDATFIIMLLLKNHCPQLRSNNIDRIFYKPKMISYLWYDIILLENQVPFFILEELFKFSNKAELVEGLSMIKLTRSFFEGCMGYWVTNDEEKDFSQVKHFIDFLRICQLPQKKKQEGSINKLVMPTATELHHAGVKFEMHPSRNKLDIEFDKGILKIPHITMSHEVELLLRNVLTFECCHFDNLYFNDYILLVSKLLISGNDVEILDRGGIIDNRQENNEAVASFLRNTICYVNPNMFYFSDVVEDLNSYEKSIWHRWNAKLRQNYFNTPWTGISVVAAGILLILTIIQTACSILQII